MTTDTLPAWILLLIPGLPLLAALLGYALSRRRGALAGWLGLAAVLGSAVVCAVLLYQDHVHQGQAQQFEFGSIRMPQSQVFGSGNESIATRELSQNLQTLPRADRELRGQFVGDAWLMAQQFPLAGRLSLGLLSDTGRMLFGLSTALIAALCLLFGLRGRVGDPRAGQFHATLTLFSAAMLLLLTADTYLLVFVAWELMGLCSFLLIGHFATERARRAAREAFWTTRVTDFGLLLGIIILMGELQVHGFTSTNFESLASVATLLHSGGSLPPEPARIVGMLGLAAIFILIAALGKLAAFPLSFWLGEAMVAPSPVSALLHAATMVAAGPFLVLQFAPLFAVSQPAMLACSIAGGLTLVLGAAMALSARDAKRVLAYSTSSQLAIPIIAVGALTPAGGLFHLLAHAWFKAPLFLVVAYLAVVASRHVGGAQHVAQHSGAADDSDDHTLLSRLAGSARRWPLALTTLIIGGLALAGIPFLGGALGKESVLLALTTLAGNTVGEGGLELGATLPLAAAGWQIAAVLMLLSLPLTAAYAVRLVGVLGWGRPAQLAHVEVESRSNAQPQRGWAVPMTFSMLVALVGCFGVLALPRAYERLFGTLALPTLFELGPMLALLVASGVLVLAGAVLALWFNVLAPQTGAKLVSDGKLASLISFFDAAMLTRSFWQRVVGTFGAMISTTLARGDERVLDRFAVGIGRDGRKLARASAWLDRHFIDGLRYWACEIWWIIRAAHRRWFQTGFIQHYMLVILLSAVVLCFIVLRPLARAFGDILGRL